MKHKQKINRNAVFSTADDWVWCRNDWEIFCDP